MTNVYQTQDKEEKPISFLPVSNATAAHTTVTTTYGEPIVVPPEHFGVNGAKYECHALPCGNIHSFVI